MQSIGGPISGFKIVKSKLEREAPKSLPYLCTFRHVKRTSVFLELEHRNIKLDRTALWYLDAPYLCVTTFLILSLPHCLLDERLYG